MGKRLNQRENQMPNQASRGDLIPINEELSRLVAALRVATVGFEKWAKDAADKRTTYDVEKAKAFLSVGEGSQEARKSEAILIVEVFMREARIAEATRDAFKERLKAIQATISVQQSRLRHLEETTPSGF
jgi:hypothetical protein